MTKFNKKKLPSRHTSLGADRAPHRSFYYAMGETEKDVAKPFVGVVSTWKFLFIKFWHYKLSNVSDIFLISFIKLL